MLDGLQAGWVLSLIFDGGMFHVEHVSWWVAYTLCVTLSLFGHAMLRPVVPCRVGPRSNTIPASSSDLGIRAVSPAS